MILEEPVAKKKSRAKDARYRGARVERAAPPEMYVVLRGKRWTFSDTMATAAALHKEGGEAAVLDAIRKQHIPSPAAFAPNAVLAWPNIPSSKRGRYTMRWNTATDDEQRIIVSHLNAGRATIMKVDGVDAWTYFDFNGYHLDAERPIFSLYQGRLLNWLMMETRGPKPPHVLPQRLTIRRIDGEEA